MKTGRFLAAVVALLMVVAMMPGTVLADTGQYFWVNDDWDSIPNGDSPPGDWDYLVMGVAAFASIQDAIDAVDDTQAGAVIINVFPGTYEEEADHEGAALSLNIDKSLILQGVNASGDIITRTDDVEATIIGQNPSESYCDYLVDADNVSISGLHLQPSGGTAPIAVIAVWGDNFSLSHCIIDSGTDYGIMIDASVSVPSLDSVFNACSSSIFNPGAFAVATGDFEMRVDDDFVYSYNTFALAAEVSEEGDIILIFHPWGGSDSGATFDSALMKDDSQVLILPGPQGGPVVFLPKASLPDDDEYTVKFIHGDAPADAPDGWEFIGGAEFTIEAEGPVEEFTEGHPAVVWINIEDGLDPNTLGFFRYDVDAEAWEQLDFEVEGNMLIVETPRWSYFALMEDQREEEEPLPVTGTRVMWLIPLGLALLFAGAMIRKRVAA